MFAVIGKHIYRGNIHKNDIISSIFYIRRLDQYIEVWNCDIFYDYDEAVEKRDNNIKDSLLGNNVNGI